MIVSSGVSYLMRINKQFRLNLKYYWWGLLTATSETGADAVETSVLLELTVDDLPGSRDGFLDSGIFSEGDGGVVS